MVADVRRTPRQLKAVRRDWRERVPTGFAVLLTIVAVFCTLGALRFGMGQQPARRFLDNVIVPAPANLAYAAFIALLAAATARRKRIAWWILIVYFGLQLLADVIALAFIVFWPKAFYTDSEGVEFAPDWWERPAVILSTLITVAFVVLLILSRRRFNARVQRASLPKAILVYALGAGLSLLLGYFLVHTFPRTLTPNDYLPYTAEKVFGGFNPHWRIDPGARSYAPVNFFLGLMGALSLLAAYFTLAAAAGGVG